MCLYHKTKAAVLDKTKQHLFLIPGAKGYEVIIIKHVYSHWIMNFLCRFQPVR